MTAWWLLGANLVFAVHVVVLHAQAPATSHPPGITAQRFPEDYSYLRDPANRTGVWWEPLKFILLDSARGVYLTLGDDVLLEHESYWNNRFGEAVDPDEGYLHFRTSPYADLHVTPRLRLFTQLVGAWTTRSRRTRTPGDQTSLDLLQAFIDVRWSLGSAGRLTGRGGRHVMSYGSERLISAGRLIRNAFDGGLVRWERDRWSVDAFYVRPVEVGLYSFDDRSDPARQLWSVYATRPAPQAGPDAGLDVYYIGFENEDAVFEATAGRELRHTLGTRWFGTRGDWQWDLEGVGQFGDVADQDIRALTLFTAVRHTLPHPWRQSYVELRANRISGDRDRDDRTLGTYNPLFPANRYFGEINEIGPVNLRTVRPIFALDLGAGWTVRPSAVFYWRDSLEDGVYDPSLDLIRPSGGSRARYVGTQGEVVLLWEMNRTLTFEGAVAALKPGRFIEETGPARTVRYALASVELRY